MSDLPETQTLLAIERNHNVCDPRANGGRHRGPSGGSACTGNEAKHTAAPNEEAEHRKTRQQRASRRVKRNRSLANSAIRHRAKSWKSQSDHWKERLLPQLEVPRR